MCVSDKKGENMKKYRFFKVLSVFSAMLLIATAVPSVAFAADDNAVTDSQPEEEIDQSTNVQESSVDMESSDISQEESSVKEESSENSDASDPNDENTELVPDENSDESESSGNPEESSGEESSEESSKEDSDKEEKTPHLVYQAYVQEVGWGPAVKDGQLAGTSGKALRMEAFRADIQDDDDLDVTYQAHVQNIGWMNAQTDMATAGTTGRNLRIEAVTMNLTGKDADKYDIYYCMHVQGFGWLGWAKNGEIAGTTGCFSRTEAIEAVLVKKGDPAPQRLGLFDSSNLIVDLRYNSHMQNLGWNSYKTSGATSGIPGAGLRLEALTISLNNSGMGGGIQYHTHIQNIGWENQWKADGQVSGTTGRSLRAEAFKANLYGQVSAYLRIWYRAYVQGIGWSGWASNGAPCGSQGQSLRMEAIQIRILPIEASAPGSTANTFYQGDPAQIAMKNKVQGMRSLTNYIILVNRSTHHIGVYKGSKGHWSEVFYSACGDGSKWTPTPEGVFNVGEKLYNFSDFYSYTAWYATQVYGGIYFHSILYAPFESHPNTIVDPALGAAVSHGCIRLPIDKAYWIFRNIPGGTTVVVYH